MKRKFVKFTDNWSDEFTVLAMRHWYNMKLKNDEVTFKVSYLDSGLDDKRKTDFSVFLVNRNHTQITDWLKKVANRLIDGTLSKKWMEKQDVHIDLKFICKIEIIAVLNFPGDNTELDKGKYPLAFMLAPVA